MTSFWKSLAFLTLTLVMAIGCDRPPKQFDLDQKNLIPGSQYWYRIVHTDSVLNLEERVERKRSERSVRFTVLDTSDQLHIEWWEQHWFPDAKDPISRSVHGEWVSMYRIEYKLNAYGEVVEVSNYPEVRSQIDPLLDQYIAHFDSTTGFDISPYVGGFRDSSWVMNSLLSDAMILHRLHGITLTEGDTLHLFSYQEHSEEIILPFDLMLKSDPICAENNISVLGWTPTGTIDIDGFIEEKIPKWPGIDTLQIGSATGQERMIVCFDTSISLPSYIEMKRSMVLNGDSLVQTRHIYLE